MLVVVPSAKGASGVLVATSLADDELPVIRYGITLARSLNAQVTLLHNVSEARGGEPSLRADLSRTLSARASELGLEAASDVVAVVGGRAAAEEAILELASERKPKLIVVGSYPRSLLTEWLVPSVCKAVLAHAICSVVVLPLGTEQ